MNSRTPVIFAAALLAVAATCATLLPLVWLSRTACYPQGHVLKFLDVFLSFAFH